MPEAVNSGTGMPDAQDRDDEIHPAPGMSGRDGTGPGCGTS
jgi:hypothetical protein